MIKDLVTTHIGRAFSQQLKDTVTPFTASRRGSRGDYDPVTDSYTQATTAITYDGRGVFGRYSDFERQDTQIDITDVKLLCLQAELLVVPKVDDEITADGVTRRVLNVTQDPAKATWTLQLRGLNHVGY